LICCRYSPDDLEEQNNAEDKSDDAYRADKGFLFLQFVCKSKEIVWIDDANNAFDNQDESDQLDEKCFHTPRYGEGI
jgi:hypothetical protein